MSASSRIPRSVPSRQAPINCSNASEWLSQRAGRTPCTFPYNRGICRSGLSRFINASTRAASASPWRTHHRKKVQARESVLRTVLFALPCPHHARTIDSVSRLG